MFYSLNGRVNFSSLGSPTRPSFNGRADGNGHMCRVARFIITLISFGGIARLGRGNPDLFPSIRKSARVDSVFFIRITSPLYGWPVIWLGLALCLNYWPVYFLDVIG